LKAERNLIVAAQQATQIAYVPYSGFLVGAALFQEDGKCRLIIGKYISAFLQ